MNVIIFTDNHAADLAPLADVRPLALLPLAGKALILHALESLHRSGLRNITVVSRDHVRIQRETDTGPLLGMNIRFTDSAPEMRESEVHSLVIDLGAFPDTHWPDLLDQFGDLDIHATVPLRLLSESQPIAMLLPPRHCGSVDENWNSRVSSGVVDVYARDLKVLRSKTLYQYFESNFAVLRGEYQTLRPSGRPQAAGILAGPKARARASSIKASTGYLGERCRIDKNASLVGEVIIGDNAIIGRNAIVDHSIVLDNTYLGDNTHCRNAIVCGNLLMRVDTGTCLKLDDPVLFGAIH